MQNKFDELKNYILTLEKQGICLAFSGGIDSTLLLYLCKNKNTLAVTFTSEFQSEEELNLTKQICKEYQIKQEIHKFYPLENEILINNPKDRCYHCKKLFFSKLKDIAKENNLKYIIDGTNYDDLNTYRPGLKALKELGILSPFAQFKITKQEIRDYAKHCKIKTYNKPSTPCFATRFPYNTQLTKDKLNIVKQGEQILLSGGFKSCRLRLHEDLARIEILKDDFEKLLNKKDTLIPKLKQLGIKYITLDLEGFRSGSMD